MTSALTLTPVPLVDLVPDPANPRRMDEAESEETH